MSDDHLAIAERLFAAIVAGDIDAVRALYAPDVRVWHNYDGIEQTGAENLRVLGWVASHIKDLHYEQVRRQATADGFVQQHVLRGTVGAVAVAIPACLIGTIRAGKIARIDEYLDSQHMKGLLSAVTPR
ncbi:MAG: nuclear transport factor 2 family protein [bacterium]